MGDHRTLEEENSEVSMDDEMQSNIWENYKHPLQLHLVVDRILSYLEPVTCKYQCSGDNGNTTTTVGLEDLGDLLTCRLVCRLWDTLATEKLNRVISKDISFPGGSEARGRCRGEVTDVNDYFLSSDDEPCIKNAAAGPMTMLLFKDVPISCLDLIDFDAESKSPIFTKHDGQTVHIIHEYLKHMETNPKLQISSFRLEDLQMSSPIMGKFFSQQGHMVKYLQLDFSTRFTYTWRDDVFERIYRRNKTPELMNTEDFRNLLIQCPNLEELVIHELPVKIIIQKFLHEGESLKTKIKRISFPETLESLWDGNGRLHALTKDFMRDLFSSCPLLEGAFSERYFSGTSRLGKNNLVFMNSLLVQGSLGGLSDLVLTTVTGEKGGQIVRLLAEHGVSGKINLRRLEIRVVRLTAGGLREFTHFLESQTNLEMLTILRWEAQDLDNPNPVNPPANPDNVANANPENPVNANPNLANPNNDNALNQNNLRIGVVFPGLPNLKHLHIGWSHSAPPTLPQGMNFAQLFPALRSLYMQGSYKFYNLGSFETFPLSSGNDIGVSHKLRKLTLPAQPSVEFVANAARLFPNVKELSIFTSGPFAVIEEIVLSWPHLESLHLEVLNGRINAKPDDADWIYPEGFVGTDNLMFSDPSPSGENGNSIEENSKDKKNGEGQDEINKVTPDTDGSQFGRICDLTELNSLIIQSYIDPDLRKKFNEQNRALKAGTDDSIYKGLWKLPSLKYLHLDNHQISVEAVNEFCVRNNLKVAKHDEEFLQLERNPSKTFRPATGIVRVSTY